MFKKEKTIVKAGNSLIGKPIPESTEQFGEKIPLIFEKSNLIHSMNRVNYIKPLPFLYKQTYKKQTRKLATYDVLNESTSKTKIEFNSHCNGIVSPGNISFTNQSGFSTHIDPYVSITTKCYKPWPWNCSKGQHITFWNWKSIEKNSLVNQKKKVPRSILPTRKQSLGSYFQSEMSSNYNYKSYTDVDESARLFKSVVLQPTDHINYNTEYSNYENKLNCSRFFKQRKY